MGEGFLLPLRLPLPLLLLRAGLEDGEVAVEGAGDGRPLVHVSRVVKRRLNRSSNLRFSMSSDPLMLHSMSNSSRHRIMVIEGGHIHAWMG